MHGSDRFGPIPDSTNILLRTTHLRLLAEKANIRALRTQDDRIFMDTERGLWKNPKGRLPRLTATDLKERLDQIQNLLESLT